MHIQRRETTSIWCMIIPAPQISSIVVTTIFFFIVNLPCGIPPSVMLIACTCSFLYYRLPLQRVHYQLYSLMHQFIPCHNNIISLLPQVQLERLQRGSKRNWSCMDHVLTSISIDGVAACFRFPVSHINEWNEHAFCTPLSSHIWHDSLHYLAHTIRTVFSHRYFKGSCKKT